MQIIRRRRCYLSSTLVSKGLLKERLGTSEARGRERHDLEWRTGLYIREVRKRTHTNENEQRALCIEDGEHRLGLSKGGERGRGL